MGRSEITGDEVEPPLGERSAERSAEAELGRVSKSEDLSIVCKDMSATYQGYHLPGVLLAIELVNHSSSVFLEHGFVGQ